VCLLSIAWCRSWWKLWSVHWQWSPHGLYSLRFQRRGGLKPNSYSTCWCVSRPAWGCPGKCVSSPLCCTMHTHTYSLIVIIDIIIVIHFHRVMLCGAQLCHSMSSIHPSVCLSVTFRYHDVYRNLQRHHSVLPAIARLSCLFNWPFWISHGWLTYDIIALPHVLFSQRISCIC